MILPPQLSASTLTESAVLRLHFVNCYFSTPNGSWDFTCNYQLNYVTL